MIRGELWWADLGIPFGSEPGYRRPVLIIQNDFFNKSRINTTIVIPLTTNLLYADVPGNVLITKSESKLKRDSVITMSQLEVIDRKRLVERITKVSNEAMEKVESGLEFILGIGGSASVLRQGLPAGY